MTVTPHSLPGLSNQMSSQHLITVFVVFQYHVELQTFKLGYNWSLGVAILR